MKIYPLLIVLLVVLPLGSGCGKRKAGKPRMGEVERLPRLETVHPELHEQLHFARTYLAMVEAFEKVDLYAQVHAGLGGMRAVVKPIPKEIDIGRHVTTGQTLIELNIPDLAADRETKTALLALAKNSLLQSEQAIQVAAAEIKESEANIQRHEADVGYKTLKQKRVEDLVRNSTLQQQLKEEADLELKSAQAALESARAQVMTKRARHEAAVKEREVAASKVLVARAEFDRFDVLMGFTTLKSPFPAIITRRWVNTGDTIKDASTPLLALHRTDIVRVLIDVPERDVRYLQTDGPKSKGNDVLVYIPALEKPDDVFPGTLTLKANAIDPVTRTMRTEVHLDNSKGLLQPNMTGTAKIILADYRKVFTVPASALVRSGNKMEIYIVAEPTGEPPRGKVKRLEVQVGLDDGHRVEIKNDNLSGREHVIVRGAGVLRPGDPVIAAPQEAGMQNNAGK